MTDSTAGTDSAAGTAGTDSTGGADGTRVTAALAEWAAGVGRADVPDAVLHQATRMLLDYAAAAVVGAAGDAATAVRSYLSAADGGDQATVVCGGLRCSAPGAALANGTAAHGMEVDDGYTPGSFHPGAVAMPAALAAAESRQGLAHPPCDLRAALVAATVAVEVACRIAQAGHPATWRRGFHNTPLAGVLGAAAGVARLLEATPAQMASTLGVAASHAGGLFEFLADGAEVKRLHAGKAARDGIVSAELAARGLTGPGTALEGANGYFAAFADGPAAATGVLDGLGREWRMLRTYVKPYPCCRHLHGPIDAILRIREEARLTHRDVERVTVETYPGAARHDGTAVANLLDAQMSIPYAVAVALRDGEVGTAQFAPDVRDDPAVRAFLDRVDVRVAEDCARDYPRMRPARVRLRLRDGSERAVRVDQPYGEPDNPVSDADLEAKFRRLCEPVVGAARCDRIVRIIWEGSDLEKLSAELAGPPSGDWNPR